MTAASRLACCVLLATACTTGDTRPDPGDLELRDVLGMSPEVATSWDADQRAGARRVIEDGLHQVDASPIRASLARAASLERGIAQAFAAVDANRARHHARALGVVGVAIEGDQVLATARAATIEPRREPPVDLRLTGWDREPWGQLPARGMDVLSTIATSAGHHGGPIVVTPAPRLAVVAGYLPATVTAPARLVVNPVVLAALEPVEPSVRPSSAAPAPPAIVMAPPAPAAPHGAIAPAAPASPGPPGVIATASPRPPGAIATVSPAGNPYSFYGSVAECATAQRARCVSCLASSSCTAITDLGDGNAECTQLGADTGRGYFLICIDLAIAIDAVASCAAAGAPACPRDPHASESIKSLENNAGFLDDPACAGPLDACLATLYGAPGGSFPGPGSDTGTSSRPRNTSVDCSNSCSGDDNCDASPGCELDEPSCDVSSDDACSDSNQQSSCDSGGDAGGGGSCSGDSEDSCGSSDSTSCSSSNGDCGSSGGGGDCGGGGGGDCSGGGGDCGGGGGDCNTAGKRGHGASLPVALIWAFLPIPFAARVRRRALRRRAREEYAREEYAREGHDQARARDGGDDAGTGDA